VNANHSIIEIFFEEEIKNPLRGKVERQLAKKNQIHLAMQLLIFYVAKEPFHNDDMQQKMFLEDMGLLIVKNHLHM
jgi:hypothetical protein